MATAPLQIEWLPQPIQIPDNKKTMVIKDPLPVIATLLDFIPPSAEDKAEHAGPKILEEFWLLLQHFLRMEINEQQTKSMIWQSDTRKRILSKSGISNKPYIT